MLPDHGAFDFDFDFDGRRVVLLTERNANTLAGRS